MPLRKIIFLVCLTAAAASLIIGLALAKQWLIALVTLLPTIAMLLAVKAANAWLAPIALLTTVGLATTGILLEASFFWMLLGAMLALVAWDLILWGHAVQSNFPHQVQLREKKHFQSLLLVMILGSLVVGIGRFLHLQLPFIAILLLAVVAVYSLDRMIHRLSTKG